MKYILMVFAGACSFGILSTFVKLAYQQGYTAAEITCSQSFISMALLWLLLLLRNKSNVLATLGLLRTTTGWLLLGVGATIGLTTYVYYLSVQYISASLAVVLLMQFTWMSILLEWLFTGKRPGIVYLVTMVTIMAGTVLASGLHHTNTSVALVKGSSLALASALLYALYIVANSKTNSQVSPWQKSAIIMTGYTLGLLAVTLPTVYNSTHYNLALVKWAAFFCLFGTLIPQLLFVKGIPKVGAGVSAIIMTVELPVAVVTAHILLGEPVHLLQWAGIVMMLLAIACMQAITAGVWHKKA